jgi:hypothetical protein
MKVRLKVKLMEWYLDEKKGMMLDKQLDYNLDDATEDSKGWMTDIN